LKVLQFDTRRQYKALKAELLSVVERTFESGQYILGPEVDAFEKEAAVYLNTSYAVGVASGTDALFLALKALGVGGGDKVVTTPFTFFATVSAILMTGAQPIFVDIDPVTFNMNPSRLEELLKTVKAIKAIVPVHLYGHPAEMDRILSIAREYGLAVVEDAAQAFGSEWDGKKCGTVSTLGGFSFFPTKNLGGFGDGGLIVTSNEILVSKIRALRAHGSSKKYYHDVVGTNSRLDALQAALLRVKLRHVDAWIQKRRQHAQSYENILNGYRDLTLPSGSGPIMHSYHQYTIRVHSGKRDKMKEFLEERQIQAAIYYPVPLHLQPALASLGYKPGNFPEAEKASQEVLSLPMFPELEPGEIQYVAQALLDYLNQG
jgi:dTDP-4-amino-4,6-dideoxygalactose transaminase